MASSVFLALSLTLFVIWGILFFFSKRTRREQVVMSLLGLILSPAVMMVSLTDYRRALPLTSGVLAIEDFLFAFCLAGVAAVIYEALLGKHLVKWRGPRILLRPKPVHWLAHMVIILGIWAGITVAVMGLFPIPSVYAFATGGLLIGTYIIADRHDLLLNALFSGALTMLILFVLEQVFFTRLFLIDAAGVWQVENLSGLLIGSVPVEEYLWFGVVGFAMGPLYEYVRRYRLK